MGRPLLHIFKITAVFLFLFSQTPYGAFAGETHPRFETRQYRNEDLMLYDTATGLVWQRRGDMPQAANQAITGGAVEEACLWEDALQYVTALNNQSYGGYRDWRLPAIEELVSIINFETVKPSGFEPFVLTQKKYYWSSTTYADKERFAWDVNFKTGEVDLGGKDFNRYYVRAVRGSDRI